MKIRTLNGIMGFNHRPKLTKRQKEYSKLIQASSKSLLSLFDDVLDRGNIETGMMEIEALPFKLDARDNSPASVSPAGCALENDGCTYTVLVAEDHQINVTVILAVLDAAGCETELAANGQQALAKLDKADFDLIIMDSQMPVMNGLEATKKNPEPLRLEKPYPDLVSHRGCHRRCRSEGLISGRQRLYDKAFQSRLLDCGRQNPRSARTCIASKPDGRRFIEAVATTLHLSGECATAFNVWGGQNPDNSQFRRAESVER